MVEVTNLIAAINPDLFCDPAVAEEVKKIVKEGLENKDSAAYQKAAKVAKPRDATYNGMLFEDIFYTGGAFNHPVSSNPIEKHTLILDTFNGSLEPIYFWILDYASSYYGKPAIKLTDTFLASTGSGHFAEMQGRATRMQEEAMKMLGAANQVIKSILNIIYDLKEFKMRLGIYDDIQSKDKNTKESARLSLKQIWLDQVDIKRGNSSIKALAVSGANQPNFVTLIDAFMVVDSLDQLKKKPEEGGIDLNDRVKRILEQRVLEFNRWIGESEKELRKRYEIEKSYLKSQVNTVKLYSRWVKPYLKAARQLEQTASANAGLVTAFNTLLLELTLMPYSPFKPEESIRKGDLPEVFMKHVREKTGKIRSYNSVGIIEFKFRSVPERAAQQQGYGVRGRLEAYFTSFALREDEFKLLLKEVEKDDMGELFMALENTTADSLAQINDDIEYFLEGKDNTKKAAKEEDSNPFSALFSFTQQEAKPVKDEKKDDFFVGLTPDNDWEKGVRNLALFQARIQCRKVYDTYKKSHGLPNFSAPGG